jgi:hypothetical protein
MGMRESATVCNLRSRSELIKGDDRDKIAMQFEFFEHQLLQT